MSIEDIRKKKMEEFQASMANQNSDLMREQIQMQQQVEMLENLCKPYLDKDAVSRYGNLKAAHPEKAIQVTVLLAQMIQTGQIKAPLDDEKFKSFLMQLQEPKKDFNIVRR